MDHGQASPSNLYEQLPPRNIRLLTVLPGTFGDPIECTLESVSLSAAPRYEAISYAWGNPVREVEIKCNGEALGVTKNLGAALQRIRRPPLAESSQERVIWVDAICINQLDIDERSHQVTFMKDVYDGAQQVLVWLGEDDGYGSRIVLLIGRVMENVRQETGDVVGRVLKTERPNAQSKLKCELPPRGHSDWRVLYWLFEHDWFSRAWIIQEVSNASGVMIMLGTLLLRWTDVAETAMWIILKMDGIPRRLAAVERPACIYALRGRGPLLRMLLGARFFVASDPRDKVYALLGLSDEYLSLKNIPLLVPDYRKPVAEVFGNVVRYILSNGVQSVPRQYRFSILGTAECTNPKLDTANAEQNDGFGKIPSWVPHWNKLVKVKVEQSFCKLAHLWNASGQSVIAVADCESSEILALKGLIVTQVAVIDKSLHITEDELDASDRPFQQLMQTVHEHLSDYPGGDTLKEALAATATAGMSRDEDTEPEAFHEKDLDGRSHEDEQTEDYSRFRDAIRVEQTFFITKNGHMGLGPFDTMVGDQMCVFFGAIFPHILRPEGNHFRLVGESYVHGFMQGEAMDLLAAGELQEQWIKLV